MNPSDGWKDVCGRMIRMKDKYRRAWTAITKAEWFARGPGLYPIEQLQNARHDLDRIIKVCTDRRADAANDAQSTALYEEAEEPELPEPLIV